MLNLWPMVNFQWVIAPLDYFRNSGVTIHSVHFGVLFTQLRAITKAREGCD